MVLNALYRLILKTAGWKITNQFPHHLPKYIIIVAPHTSWLDIILGFLVRGGGNVSHAKFLGKDSLFKNKWYAWFFWYVGGYPVNRSTSTNFVAEVVGIFNREPNFVLALSPEGSRKKVERWRTGFYYIAQGAGVPIVPITFDFGKKEVFINPPFTTTQDITQDFEYLQSLYKGVKGYNAQ